MKPSSPHPNDAEILRRLCEGDDLALRMLIETHGPQVRAQLRNGRARGMNDEQLEEILIAGVVQLWQVRDRFDSRRGTLGAWFARISEREALRIHREERKLRQTGIAMDGVDVVSAAFHGAPVLGQAEASQRDSQLPQPLFAGGPVTQALRACIEELSPLEKQIILADLRRGETVDAKILEEECGTSAASIYPARSRARAKIRRAMQEKGFFLDLDEGSAELGGPRP